MLPGPQRGQLAVVQRADVGPRDPHTARRWAGRGRRRGGAASTCPTPTARRRPPSRPPSTAKVDPVEGPDGRVAGVLLHDVGEREDRRSDQAASGSGRSLPFRPISRNACHVVAAVMPAPPRRRPRRASPVTSTQPSANAPTSTATSSVPPPADRPLDGVAALGQGQQRVDRHGGHALRRRSVTTLTVTGAWSSAPAAAGSSSDDRDLDRRGRVGGRVVLGPLGGLGHRADRRHRAGDDRAVGQLDLDGLADRDHVLAGGLEVDGDLAGRARHRRATGPPAWPPSSATWAATRTGPGCTATAPRSSRRPVSSRPSDSCHSSRASVVADVHVLVDGELVGRDDAEGDEVGLDLARRRDRPRRPGPARATGAGRRTAAGRPGRRPRATGCPGRRPSPREGARSRCPARPGRAGCVSP